MLPVQWIAWVGDPMDPNSEMGARRDPRWAPGRSVAAAPPGRDPLFAPARRSASPIRATHPIEPGEVVSFHVSGFGDGRSGHRRSRLAASAA